ncbi:MAG: 50S ribosomal protein L13 [Myxococcales bacterium]|nr:50S ribosomal protein L13 [Myxococcales bacterium]
MKTESAKLNQKGEVIIGDQVEPRKWYVVDAAGQRLGRVATVVASVLRGKNKPTYTPHVDTGDFVVVVNVDKIELTGQKWTTKFYHWHTGYPGGLRSIRADKLREKDAEQLFKHAVKGMLPRGPLGRRMLKKLKAYSAAEHPHDAQQPKTLSL